MVHENEEDLKIGCCQSEDLIYRNMSDYTAVRKLEAFNEVIYKKMDRRKKAIQNWQRMKVLLAILKICGNRMEKKEAYIPIEV